MKPTFKTTALSLLVALGVVACSSGGNGGNNSSPPTSNITPIYINVPSTNDLNKAQDILRSTKEEESKARDSALRAQQSAEQAQMILETALKKLNIAKIEFDEAAAANRKALKSVLDDAQKAVNEARAAAKQAQDNAKIAQEKLAAYEKAVKEADVQVNKLEKEKQNAKQTEDKQPENNTEKPQEKNQDPPQEKPQINAEQERIDREKVELEKYRLTPSDKAPASKEWRGVTVRNFGVPHSSDFAGESMFLDLRTYNKDRLANQVSNSQQILINESPFEKTPETVIINLNDITAQDIEKGGRFLGEHSGVFKDNDIQGVKATKLGDIGGGSGSDIIGLGETENVNSVNYVFINQPYSSYGALFTNTYDSGFFAMGQLVDHYEPLYTKKNGSKEVTYRDNVKGDAIYKGNVIAKISRAYGGSKAIYDSEPKVDGEVIIQAHFDNNLDKNWVKGEVNSKSVGKIELWETQGGVRSTYSDHPDYSQFEGKAGNDKTATGHYHGSFVGKDANEVIGHLRADFRHIEDNDGNYKKDAITHYEAVFGAEKQPK